MAPFYRINGIGDVYVPAQFRDIAPDDVALKLFSDSDLGQLNRIFNHLRRGGVAILEGEWERIAAVTAYIDRKKRELTQAPQVSKQRRNTSSNADRPGVNPMLRLMGWVDNAGLLQTTPPPDLPDLLELVGEPPEASEGCPFLIPIPALQQIQNALAELHPVDALDLSLLASENVLPPRSQETIQLFQQGLRSVNGHLPAEASILDMGCGCGCLTLLVAQELGEVCAHIYATDTLPEAVATTRLNVQRFAYRRRSPPPIHVMPAGDLFQPVATLHFDLIIFNAPWVVARARNRSEIPIHDENQNTLRRFFHAAPDYLNEQGRLLIGYADASGAKAIGNLETMIAEAGLTIVNRFKKRVATHRSRQKWENIMVYELAIGQ